MKPVQSMLEKVTISLGFKPDCTCQGSKLMVTQRLVICNVWLIQMNLTTLTLLLKIFFQI